MAGLVEVPRAENLPPNSVTAPGQGPPGGRRPLRERLLRPRRRVQPPGRALGRLRAALPVARRPLRGLYRRGAGRTGRPSGAHVPRRCRGWDGHGGCGDRCGGGDPSPCGAAGPTGGAPSRSPNTNRGPRTHDRAGAARGGRGAGGGAHRERRSGQGPGPWPVGQRMRQAAQGQRADQNETRTVSTFTSASSPSALGGASAHSRAPIVGPATAGTARTRSDPRRMGSSCCAGGCPTRLLTAEQVEAVGASANASGATSATSPTARTSSSTGPASRTSPRSGPGWGP